MIDMLIERIEQPGRGGRPRSWTASRATCPRRGAGRGAGTKAGKCVDVAVNIAVPDEELVRRLGGRWMCRNCGAIYQQSDR